jgi:hypothetical protein
MIVQGLACTLGLVTKDSEALEQQIHRIYQLLEESGAAVVWNDRIPDPDCPTQQRQVDVTITRDGRLTLVECRKHKFAQDVQWIEELIGRRTSLRADAVIAVSASGFTAGALEKAKKHGVSPRDLQRLTDREIKSWGRRVGLTLFFYQYFNLELSLLFGRESIPKLGAEAVRSELRFHPCLQSLFRAAAQQLASFNLVADKQPGRTVEFDLKLQLEAFCLGGEPVLEVAFKGNARLVAEDIASPAVFAYGAPSHNFKQHEATVEEYSLGKTSIAHVDDRVSVLLDISQFEMPPFYQFRFFRLSEEREMDHEAVKLYGLDTLVVSGKGMNVNICSV